MRNIVGIVGENNFHWNRPFSTPKTILDSRSSYSISVYQVISIGCVLGRYSSTRFVLHILLLSPPPRPSPLQSIFQMTPKRNSYLFSFFEKSSSKYVWNFLNSWYSFSKITLHENVQNNFQKLNHWDLIILRLLTYSWSLTLVLWIWDY